ncbi:hypothetical protein [Haliscomenobacter sp.]|uniref:tetratricopeptide repeat protein n=1 Tax=Haliscomenobacter sp. TaxID=2717303 RepID=UPI0035940890
MEDYEQYLSDNAEDDERRAAAQVLEGLAGLRLESKLREVAAEEAALRRRTFWRRLLTLAALAFLAAVAYWFFSKNEATPAAPPSEKQAPSAPAPSKEQAPEQYKLEKPREKPPIAQIKPKEEVPVPPDPIFPTFALQDELIPDPLYAAPDLVAMRGESQANTALKALLDQLWYVDYPLFGLKTSAAYGSADQLLQQRNFSAAYQALDEIEQVQIDSLSRRIARENQKQLEKDPTASPVAAMPVANDTILYLKAYCMLEMGEGQEAMFYFYQMYFPDPAWIPQLTWYRALALLQANNRKEALILFTTIAANPGHPYRRQARKAMKLLQ